MGGYEWHLFNVSASSDPDYFVTGNASLNKLVSYPSILEIGTWAHLQEHVGTKLAIAPVVVIAFFAAVALVGLQVLRMHLNKEEIGPDNQQDRSGGEDEPIREDVEYEDLDT